MGNHDVVVVPAGGPELTGLAKQMVAKARQTGIEMTGQDGMLTALTRQVLQSISGGGGDGGPSGL